MGQHLNVLIQSSDYYAPFAGVMLTSLFANNKNIEDINIYLMTSDMTNQNRERFLMLSTQYKRTIRFIDTKKIDDFLEKNQAPRYNDAYTPYYKIFALSEIEDEIDRLIYLDSDMVVLGSLSGLSTWNLGPNALGMCYDVITSRYSKKIKCNSKSYYNSGMMVFDVKKWINDEKMKKIIDHMTKVQVAYPLVDQDLLNIVFENQIATIPLKYNLNSGILEYVSYKFWIKAHGIDNYYSEEEFMQAQQDPVILHCMGTFGTRPWYEGNHVAKEIWCKYLEISPWSDYIFKKGNATFMQRVQRYLFKTTPKCFFATVNRMALYLHLKGMLRRLRAKE